MEVRKQVNMNIPMNRKSPIRLEAMAASMGRNVQKPRRLQQNTGNAARMPRQAAPARVPGQDVGRASAGIQPGHPMPSPASRKSVGQPGRSAVPAPLPPRRKALAGTRLRKGQKVSLAENGCPLSQVEVSIGWNAKSPACDLDASAFLLSGNNKVLGDEWFVFYGQERSPDGSVVHHGDMKGGMGESLTINWRSMDSRVKKIVFTITINEALKHGLNFGMVSDAYIQLRSLASGQGILHFELEEYYSNVTSMMVGELYERNGEWKFHAIGNGVARDLAGLCELYGVNVSG